MSKRLTEKWVQFDTLPNYAVSNYGRVINIKTARNLTPSPDGKGYYRVALYHRGVRNDVYVHRLVAQAFIAEYQEGIEVRHSNGDRANNAVTNLIFGGGCRAPEEKLW